VIEFLALVLALIGLTDEKQNIKEYVQDSIIYVKPNPDASGTGFVLKIKGTKYVITNKHVCREASTGTIELVDNNGKSVRSNVMFADYVLDLCAIKVPKIEAPALVLGKQPAFDDKVFYVGYPLIQNMSVGSGKYQGWMQNEIESDLPLESCVQGNMQIAPNNVDLEALARGVLPELVCLVTTPVYHTDITIDFGASGSPLLNDQGKVIGVVFQGVGQSMKAQTVTLKQLKSFIKLIEEKK
jgi:S1-C subfamily serine protease